MHEFELGNADAVLTRYHPAQAARQRHDAGHRLMRGLQHGVVVAVDGDVGMHIAVTGVHMQRRPGATAQHLLVDAFDLAQNGRKRGAGKQRLEGLEYLGFPTGAQALVLQLVKVAAAGLATIGLLCQIQLVEPLLPLRPHLGQLGQRLLHPVVQQLSAGDLTGIVGLAQRQVAVGQKRLQPIQQFKLGAQAQLDIDALDAQGVLTHAL